MTAILLIEDNPEMQQLLRESLEWGGHQVIGGRTGVDGLRILQTLEPLPDVIISDLNMPQMDGMALFREVRGNPAWSSIRFIIMSANTDDDRLNSLAAQALDGVLPKPFTLEDLSRILAD